MHEAHANIDALMEEIYVQPEPQETRYLGYIVPGPDSEWDEEAFETPSGSGDDEVGVADWLKPAPRMKVRVMVGGRYGTDLVLRPYGENVEPFDLDGLMKLTTQNLIDSFVARVEALIDWESPELDILYTRGVSLGDPPPDGPKELARRILFAALYPEVANAAQEGMKIVRIDDRGEDELIRCALALLEDANANNEDNL
jgi:hypothetical protein